MSSDITSHLLEGIWAHFVLVLVIIYTVISCFVTISIVLCFYSLAQNISNDANNLKDIYIYISITIFYI